MRSSTLFAARVSVGGFAPGSGGRARRGVSTTHRSVMPAERRRGAPDLVASAHAALDGAFEGSARRRAAIVNATYTAKWITPGPLELPGASTG